MDATLHSAPSPKDIVAEANHRIANSLTLLVGLVRMQAGSLVKRAKPLTSAEARLILEGIAARISTISQLHHLLSHVPQDGVTSLKPHLHDVTDALVAALSSAEQPVTVAHTGEDCLVQVRQIQPIILILCEIFVNAMKYAHPAGVLLVMSVDCVTAADGRLVITIGDDGVGLPEGFDPYASHGLGFKVIRSLAGEIGAQLDIASTALGLTFRLSMPASAMASARLA
jgi:two-component sensor histidine kinase